MEVHLDRRLADKRIFPAIDISQSGTRWTSMPYLNPGSLTDQEAQELAAFIDSKPRPLYPYKEQDYRTEKLPADSVYYFRP